MWADWVICVLYKNKNNSEHTLVMMLVNRDWLAQPLQCVVSNHWCGNVGSPSQWRWCINTLRHVHQHSDGFWNLCLISLTSPAAVILHYNMQSNTQDTYECRSCIWKSFTANFVPKGFFHCTIYFKKNHFKENRNLHMFMQYGWEWAQKSMTTFSRISLSLHLH